MYRCPVILALWLLPISAAWSVEPGPPPTQQVLQVDASGQWQLQVQVAACKLETRTRAVTKRVPETKTVTETVDGKPVQRTVTQYKEVLETQQYTVSIPEYHSVTQQIPAAVLKAYETDGRSIPLDKLRSRVGTQTLVVVSATDAKLPEAYASLFKPGTIVIAMEKSKPAEPIAAPMPAVPVTAPLVAPQPKIPRSVAPQFVMLGRSGMDDIVVRRALESTFPTTGMAVFKKGTVNEQAPVQMMQTIRQSESFTMAARHLHFHLGDSADIPFERIKERIAREAAVVYSVDGEAIDPFWLQNLKSTTIVVVGPQLPALAPGCGPASPAVTPAPVGIPAPVPMQAIPTPAVRPMPPSPPVPQKAPEAPKTEPVNQPQQSAIERELIDRANAERTKASLAPLTAERLVNLAASTHAANMAQHATLSHALDDQGVSDRLSHFGFRWVKCAENIARGQETPTEAIESWMNSPGHRQNLLGSHYTHIGVACSDAPDGQKYWTMVLAQAR